MILEFLQVQFNLKFLSLAFADTNPLFVLRSVLGKNLRSMCCIARKSKCTECQFSKTCVYAFLFETILSSDNDALPGRNRASHPYSFSSNQNQAVGNLLKEYSFKMTLFGKAVDYLPYIYAAFVRSGQNGLFKSRVQFEIESVLVDGRNILIDENHLDMNFSSSEWNCDFSDFRKDCNAELAHAADKEIPSRVRNDDVQSGYNGECKKSCNDDNGGGLLLCARNGEYNKSFNDCAESASEILVNLKSPLRFKVQGKYTMDFTAQDFMNCLFRRAKTLCSLYGEISSEERNLWSLPAENLEITEKNLRWIDLRHYSARQKTAMDLGGAVGTFKLCGKFSDAEKSLLKLAEIAGAGKNTNFGLGQMDCWEK